MESFSKEMFEALANVHEKHCISIYLSPPTTEPDKRQQSVIKLKNIHRELMSRLQNYGMKKVECEEYLKPIKNLLELDNDFWMFPSRGMAIFLRRNDFRVFRFPFAFNETHYLADHFYLLPLSEIINQEWTFYLLGISINKVRLCKGNFYEMEEIDIGDEIPRSLTDALGEDYVQKSLQLRGRGDSNARPYYHGQGSGTEKEKKEEVAKYFLQIDRALTNKLNHDDRPLIFAGVDFLFPIYKQVNRYRHLLDTPIEGNFDEPDMQKLHRQALKLLMPHFEQEKAEKKKKFLALLSKGLSSYEMKNVIPATMAGRIETLFVKKNELFPGRYFRDDNRISVDEKIEPGVSDLLNMAAVETIMHNGSVYLVNGEEMPDEHSPVNAILRY